MSSWGGYIINDERRGVTGTSNSVTGDHIMSVGVTRGVTARGEHNTSMGEPVSTTSTDSHDGLGYPRPPDMPAHNTPSHTIASQHISSHNTPSHSIPNQPYSTPSKSSSYPSSDAHDTRPPSDNTSTLTRPLKNKKTGQPNPNPSHQPSSQRGAQGQGLGEDSVYTYVGGESVYVGSPVSISGVLNNAGELRGPGPGGDINAGARDRNRAVNTTV